MVSNWHCTIFFAGCRGLMHVCPSQHDTTIVEARDGIEGQVEAIVKESME